MFFCIIIEQECQELQPIIKDFVQCYVENNDKPVEVWLEAKMREQLPNASDNEIKSISGGTLTEAVRRHPYQVVLLSH